MSSSDQSPRYGFNDTGKALLNAAGGIVFFLLGVLLPTVALFTELTTRMCAEVFFDPVPTLAHTLLVALVPVGNLIVWYRLRVHGGKRLKFLSLLNGLVLGIASFYTLLFLPLTPIAIMVSWTGMGLLPLAPMFALIAAIISRHHLRQHLKQNQQRHWSLRSWPGLLGAFLLLLGIQLPATLTHYGLQLAASEDLAEQVQGIRLLRNWGDEHELLRACYYRTGRIPDMINFLLNLGKDPVLPPTAQIIYYRVTGQPFNAVPAPQSHHDRFWDSEFGFDQNRGGEQVAGRIKGLALASSTFEGSVATDAALAYLEWTFVVSNSGAFNQEARMQVALPPGATVSRVTLWVNGEPREAAFAGRGKVTEAYQNIVRQSRDPLLVTLSAPDTIRVQMFPVPADGQMKARIGMTVPLQLQDKATALLPLPRIVERNHTIAASLQHAIWLESRHPLAGNNPLLTPHHQQNTYALRGLLTDATLNTGYPLIQFKRNPDITTVYTPHKSSDPVSQPAAYIQQTLLFEQRAYAHIVLVVDGSSIMQNYNHFIADSIQSLSRQTRLSVLLAGDELVEFDSATLKDHSQLAMHIRQHDYVGGMDNAPALQRAWELATKHNDAVIVWVHGPQPVQLSNVDTLLTHWQRRPDHPLLFDLAIGTGHNRIAEQLVTIPSIRTVSRSNNLNADLLQLFARLGGNQSWPVLARQRISKLPSGPHVKQTSDHLLRLWARDRINQLAADQAPGAHDQAIRLASQYHIVTPVSGAVVLETDTQYKQAGLEPVAPSSVPTVPEPEEWALIIITLFTLGWMWLRQRAQAGGMRLQA